MSTLVALVTINAVVDIPRHIVVLEIVRVVAAMATRALEDGVVIRVDVAGGADVVGVAVAGRERRVLGVIEIRIQPVGRAMAGLAGGWEELGLRRVSGIRSVVVIGLVAANA